MNEPKLPRFVVHKHNSSRLHFDLRIEKDGVLKSWALPKEPPRKCGVKRLALPVADHPLGYANFIGKIDKGYGAGTVEIWDQGSFKPLRFDSQGIIADFKGRKLCGKYCLIKMHQAAGKAEQGWLFLKMKPAKSL